jgi:hypothetical protein
MFMHAVDNFDLVVGGAAGGVMMVTFRRKAAWACLLVLLAFLIFPCRTLATELDPAPTNVRFNEVSYNSLNLSWDAVAGAVKYSYIVSTASECPIPDVLPPFYDYTSVYLSSLIPGTTYYARVCAYKWLPDKSGYKRTDWSPIVSAAPAVPTPQNLSVISTGYNSLRFNWAAVGVANGYQVEWLTGTSGWSAPINVTTNVYNLGSLICGSIYSFRVRAYVTIGKNAYYSNWSGSLSGIPIPSAPGSLSAYSSEYDTVRLSWHAVDGASGYEIWRKTSLAEEWAYWTTTTSTSYYNNGLLTGHTYYYHVRAFRIVTKSLTVNGEWSNTVSCAPIPAAPLWVAVQPANYNTLAVTWASVLGADGYTLRRAPSASGPWTTLSSSLASPSYSDSGLTTGMTYFYDIAAYHLESKEHIASPWSVAGSGVPVPSKPAGLLVATIDADTLRISWSSVVGATGYIVQRAMSASGPWAQIADTGKLTLNDNGLAASTLYYYQVKAYAEKVSGYYCSPVGNTTAALVPSTSATTAGPESPSPTPAPSTSTSTEATTTTTIPASTTSDASQTTGNGTITQETSEVPTDHSNNSTTNPGGTPGPTDTASGNTTVSPSTVSTSTSQGDGSSSTPGTWFPIVALAVLAGAGLIWGTLSFILYKKKPK